MNILVFGSSNEADELIDSIDSHEHFIFRKKAFTRVTNYDSFLQELKNPQDVIFVLEDGAIGMESVIASKSLCKKTPVVWFSNDKSFGAQSYRLGTEFFANKPVTNEHISLVAKKLRIS